MSKAKVSTRRSFIRNAAGVAATGTLIPTLEAYADRADRLGPGPYGPIAPVADETTGLPLLKLPSGFSYRSVGWTGDLMSDGTLTPDRHDGMAIVSTGKGKAGEMVLIRNHERGATEPGNPVPTVGVGQAPTYDPFAIPGVIAGLGGGTTTMHFKEGRLIRDHASLAGTLTNCAGGPTPWRSWLTCEETTIRGSLIGALDHGYVYEVPSPDTGVLASARPIVDMGFMDHEAVAVDPYTSVVYLTEDNGPNSGFYRFTPNDPSMRVGSLENGGKLEMMKVRGEPNRNLIDVQQGDEFEVEWVSIDEPNADPEGFASPGDGFPPISGVGKSGPFLQGEAQGAAFFNRGEGCWSAYGAIYFIDTSGGPARKGVVWAYYPTIDRLYAVFVSPDEATADNPDNIAVSPTGYLIVCEDGGGQRDANGDISVGARLLGIDCYGGSFTFAENNMIIDSALPDRPFIALNDYRGSEWAGACFDPVGEHLFVNIQTPGVTYVISGPWSRGPL